MKKRLLGLVGLPLLLSTAGGALNANAQTRVKLPNNYKTTFQNNLIKGCTAAKPASISQRDHNKFCSCYADRFIRRYNAEQLYVINNSLPKNRSELNKAVQAFMAPEISACRRKR